jgi:hypothetical protein
MFPNLLVLPEDLIVYLFNCCKVFIALLYNGCRPCVVAETTLYKLLWDRMV